MSKLVKPVFPMSEEEHDKYVNLAWEGGKMSIQELKVREIIDKDIMQYSTGVICAPENNPLIQKVGIHFRFSDTTEAVVKMLYNLSLTTLYNFTIQVFENMQEKPEYFVEDSVHLNMELHDILKSTEKKDADSEFACEYCADGTDEYGISLIREDLKIGNTTVANIDVYIGEKDNMEMLITNCTDEVISKQVIKIKHCPMCGRELNAKVINDAPKVNSKEENLKKLDDALNNIIEDIDSGLLS